MPNININRRLLLSRLLDGGSAPIVPSDYLLRYLDASNEFIPMDGVGFVNYNNELHLICGWNATINAPPASKKTHWKSTDGGYTWTQLTDFGGAERHAAGYLVFNNKIWVFGGDFLTDVWNYDSTNGWVLVTADWGIGDRGLFTYWADDNYIYLAGGQDTIPSTNFYTTVYRTSDGITWTSIGNLPDSYVSTGIGLKYGNDFYVIGGGRYVGAGVINWNTEIYKSTNGGVTWTTIASALPNAMRAGYPAGAVWDNKIWYLMGTDTTGNNAPGLWYTTDFTSWTTLYDNPRPRHAEQLAVQNNKLYVVAGNLWNDSTSIEKVTQTTGLPSGAVAAYGFFKGNFNATSCIQVERSSDNTSTFIGFDTNGYVDINALLAFVGTGDGRVISWIDLSGNGKDVSAAYAEAPVICISGSMNLENGLAALLCASGKKLNLTSPLSLGTTHSIHAVCKMTSYGEILAGTSTYAFYPIGTDICYYNAGGSYTTNYSATNEPFPLNQQVLVELYRRDEEVQMFLNGVKMGDASSCSAEFMSANNVFTFDRLLGEAAAPFIGNMQTIIIYDTDKFNYRKGISDYLIDLYNI